MVEFTHENDVEHVANAELRSFKAAVDVLEGYCDVYKKRGEQIPDGEFEIIVDSLTTTLADAEQVIERCVRNGLSPDVVSDFIQYARKKISIATRFINDDKTILAHSATSLDIGSLRLQTFSEEYLDLFEKILSEEKASSPNFVKLRADFSVLTGHPAAKRVPSLGGFAGDLPNKLHHPEILLTKPVGAEQAELTDDETANLVKLLQDNGKDTRWLQGNSPAIRTILEQVSNYTGSPPQESYLRGPEDLRALLEQLIEKYQETEKVRLVNSSVTNDALSTYELTEERANELVEVLNRIVDINKDPDFVAWEIQLKNKQLTESDPAGITYEDFLAVVKAKIDAHHPLTPEEKRDLSELLRYLRGQRQNVRSTQYADPSNTYNRKIWIAEEKLTDQEIDKVRNLLAVASTIDGGGKAGGGSGAGGEADAGKEGAEVLVVEAMYNFLRENRNRRLPSYEEVRDGHLSISPPQFMQELTLALCAHLAPLFDKSSSSGSSPIPLPSMKVDVWGDYEIGLAKASGNIPDIGIKRNFEFFFDTFPWHLIVKDVFANPDDLERFVYLWKMRMVHITMMHNDATEVRLLQDKVADRKNSEEFPLKMAEMLANFGNDGGLYPPDMEAYFTNTHPSTSKLSELLGSGKEIGWLMPDYSQLFLHLIDRRLGAYNPENPKFVQIFRELKSEIFDLIPPSIRMKNPDGTFRDGPVLDRAWEEAIWRFHVEMTPFRHDKEANFTKTARATELSFYGKKTLPGMNFTSTIARPAAVESIERAIVYPDDFIYQYVDLPPTAYENLEVAELKTQMIALRDFRGAPEEERRKKREAEELYDFYIDLLRKSGGTDADITQRYKIIKVKPRYCVFGLNLGLPVAIPKAFIEHVTQFKPEHQNYIPMTERQVTAALLDRSKTDIWSSISPSHKSAWGAATHDTIEWYKLLDIKKKDAVFTPAHDPRITEKVRRLQTIWESFEWVREQVDKLRTWTWRDNKRAKKFALSLDKRLRHHIRVDTITDDEVAKVFGFTKFTQGTGRYGFAGELTQNSPVIPGEPLLAVGELWVDQMHTEWSGGDFKGKLYKDITDISRITRDAATIRGATITTVRPQVRAATDLFENPHRTAIDEKRARNQIIAEQLVIAFSSYLDQYRYESVDAGESIGAAYDLDRAYSRIRTLGSLGTEKLPPLDFAHREAVLAFMMKQMTLLQEGGNYEGGLIRNYDKDYFVKMMMDKGIIGTYEQCVVDLYYRDHEFKKLQSDTAEAVHGGKK